MAVDFIATIPLFQGLNPSQLERVRSISVEKPVERGQLMFLQGSKADGFYVVKEGQVKIFKSAPDGREAVLHVLGPGEPFGEVVVFQGGRFPAAAMAVEKGRVVYFPRDALVRLIESDATLAMNMLAALSRKLREFASKIESLTLKELPQRLAAYLLHESVERGAGDAVELDMTKGLLAQLLGATRETLSRTFSRFVDEGLIEVQGRNIRLLRRDSLEDIAEGR